MGVPKGKRSKRRNANRRATYKLSPQTIVACPRCHEPKLAHQVCASCGYYKDQEVIQK